jgi:hypothetical protein
MKEPERDFGAGSYERPDQIWVCGNAQFGTACPLGPNRNGRCVTTALCEPILVDGAWKCNRSRLQGGMCDSGPLEDGSCGCPVLSCSPCRTLRSHRGRVAAICFAATLALLAILLSSPSRNALLVPGPLTEPHAQIMRDQRSRRCAHCHAAGSEGLGGWLLAATLGPAPSTTKQWQLCLHCHENRISPARALVAHTASHRELARLTEKSAQHRATEDGRLMAAGTVSKSTRALACATCHREHHGAEHDLTAMSDQQCSTCHQAQFPSFARGHPEFRAWPYRRRSRIIFDHVSHGERHFREAQQVFQCATCHEVGPHGEPRRLVGYEQDCATCHEADMRRSMSEPLALIRLPMIDRELLSSEGLSVGQWPEEFNGDFDGSIPPLMLLMLWADPLAKASLEQFGPGFGFLDVDPDNFDDLEAASDLVWSIKRLIYELGTDGDSAILWRAKRLYELRGTTFQPEQFEALVAGFDRSALVRMASTFPRLGLELKSRSRGDVRPESPPRAVVVGSTATWHGSTDGAEFGVQVSQHASPLLRAWLDLAGQLGDDGLRYTDELTKATGVGQCTMCHSLEYSGHQRTTAMVNWQTRPAPARVTGVASGDGSAVGSSLTKFRHAPHVMQSSLEECTSCHRPDASAPYAASYESLDPSRGCSGFTALSKTDCAGCHVRNGAGDACLKCHNYHVDRAEVR